MILFTCDIDWAHDDIIENTLCIFEKFNIKCTFFATHNSHVLKSCNNELFEIGIHPNFNKLLNGGQGSPEKVIDDLLKEYPDAKGVRSHSLVESTQLLNVFAKKGLQYDINMFLPYKKIIHPFKLWNGLTRVTFNWEDDLHLEYGNSMEELNITFEEEIIVDFHPIHIYLNTENITRYADAKIIQHNIKELKSKINCSKKPGAKDLLIKLISHVKQNNLQTKTIREYLADNEN